MGSYILLTLYATEKDIIQFCVRATTGPHNNSLAVRTGGDVPDQSCEKKLNMSCTSEPHSSCFEKRVWGSVCAVWFAVDMNVMQQ